MIRITVLLLLYASSIFSQDFQNSNSKLLQDNFHKNSTIYSLPFIAGSLALTGILLATDDETYESFIETRKQSSIVRKISPLVTQLGDGKFSLALFGSIGIYHLISHDKNAGKAAVLGFESFLLSGVAVQILKHTFGRERPSNSTMEGGKWSGPFITHKGKSIACFDSFPSGHTATIFAAASTLSYIYPNGIVPYISYSVASLVALSRVTESTHWLSDCLVGGLIGYFSTKFIFDLKNNKSNFYVGVINYNNEYNLLFSYNF